MRVIFLDIDGVLNSRQYDRCRKFEEGNIDESRLVLLKQLVDQTGAMIVLSSSWRRHWDPRGISTDDTGLQLDSLFKRYGMILYDRTPEIDNDRAREIAAWLSDHQRTESFVILDDIKFGWGDLDEKVVKTDYRIGRGLEQRHVEKAIKILMKAE